MRWTLPKTRCCMQIYFSILNIKLEILTSQELPCVVVRVFLLKWALQKHCWLRSWRQSEQIFISASTEASKEAEKCKKKRQRGGREGRVKIMMDIISRARHLYPCWLSRLYNYCSAELIMHHMASLTNPQAIPSATIIHSTKKKEIFTSSQIFISHVIYEVKQVSTQALISLPCMPNQKTFFYNAILINNIYIYSFIINTD